MSNQIVNGQLETIKMEIPGMENYVPGYGLPFQRQELAPYQEASRKRQEPDYSIAEIKDLATQFAASGYFNDALEMSQCFTKIMAGKELGIAPQASLREIYIVKGKVSLSAMMVGALIKKSGKYDYKILEHTSDICKIEFFIKENGDKESLGVSSFSLEDAKKAGLTTNSTWQKFARNMLFSRAMTNGARWHCPDIFAGGIYTPDELDDKIQIDEEGAVVADFTVKKNVAKKASPAKETPVVVKVDTTATVDSNKASLISDINALVKELNFDITSELSKWKVSSLESFTVQDLVGIKENLNTRKSLK